MWRGGREGGRALYNWSVTTSNSASTACKEKNKSLEISFEEDMVIAMVRRMETAEVIKLEESERILDFQMTSVESGRSER